MNEKVQISDKESGVHKFLPIKKIIQSNIFGTNILGGGYYGKVGYTYFEKSIAGEQDVPLFVTYRLYKCRCFDRYS